MRPPGVVIASAQRAFQPCSSKSSQNASLRQKNGDASVGCFVAANSLPVLRAWSMAVGPSGAAGPEWGVAGSVPGAGFVESTGAAQATRDMQAKTNRPFITIDIRPAETGRSL